MRTGCFNVGTDLTLESVRQLAFDLGYRQHGGSGLGYSWDVVMEMPLADIFWNVRRLREVREEEAKAIERARSRK